MRKPKCKKCGHGPCPGCVDWCDVMVWNIYCPKCDEVLHEIKESEADGDAMECQHCKHDFRLRLPGCNHDDDDIGVDPCCDHECEWDQPMWYVEDWCHRMKNAS